MNKALEITKRTLHVLKDRDAEYERKLKTSDIMVVSVTGLREYKEAVEKYQPTGQLVYAKYSNLHKEQYLIVKKQPVVGFKLPPSDVLTDPVDGATIDSDDSFDSAIGPDIELQKFNELKDACSMTDVENVVEDTKRKQLDAVKPSLLDDNLKNTVKRNK
jgi:hypothetical protein